MGARPLGRVIQEHIKKPLADQVLFGDLRRGGTVKVTVEKDDTGKEGLKLTAVPDEVTVKPKKVAAPKPKRARKPAAKKKATPKPKVEAKPAAGSRPSTVPRLPRKR